MRQTQSYVPRTIALFCKSITFFFFLPPLSPGDQSPRTSVPVYEPPAAPSVPVQHARQGQAAPVLRI